MREPYIRPDVRDFLAYIQTLDRPKAHLAGPDGARRMLIASRHAFETPAKKIRIGRNIEGPVPLRLYDDRPERGPGPLLVFLHGGGWVIGDLETHEPFCIDVAKALDLPVVAVDYRLAPEHPFPAGLNDALAATRWIAAAPPQLERAPTALFLAGDSAGGNLACVISASLRDSPAMVPIAGQWLIYPASDPEVRYPSYAEFNSGYVLTKESMDWFEDCYAAPRGDWRYSPLLAGTSGLPPTFVVTAGLDPIRDQGRAYASRCAEAGVETIYLEVRGTVHGFLNLRGAIPSGREDFARCMAYLKPWVEQVR
ncbi:MAG TPA: alpha/beta hydrolase [Sphingomicrobium sp.]|nr:alpha/beta hydrolase [Sphingomicrobium sp.]